MAHDGPVERSLQAPKPGNRRAKLLIAVGVVLLIVAVIPLVLFDDDASAPSGAGSDPGPGAEDPTPGLDDEGAGGTDWDVVFAAAGAVSGMGSLVLGIADFAHKNRRLARDQQRTGADWRDGSGYL